MDSQPANHSASLLRVYGLRTLGWLAILSTLILSIVAGLQLRRWVFAVTAPIRFVSDDVRGSFWGLTASGPEGYLNQYDKMDPQIPEWQDSKWVPWLDYVPLRLLVMREWGAWQRAYHPPEPDDLFNSWRPDYWFNAPVLRFNSVLEGIAAVCAFFLTRLWVIRGNDGESNGHFLGVWQGLVAALAIWFSFDLIINSHGWVQWDTWVVPFYLGACLLASLDWWFAAGLAVAIGVNLKGQMLSISPIFIIWPLVAGRFGAACRWTCGMAFGFAAIVSGWLITYLPPSDQLNAIREFQSTTPVSQYPADLFALPRSFDYPAAIWIFAMLLAAASVPFLVETFTPAPSKAGDSRAQKILRSKGAWKTFGVIFVTCLVCLPWLLPQNRSTWYVGILAGIVVSVTALRLRRRHLPYLAAAIIAGGLFACIPLFHGSLDWWDCGFRYGANHWPYLETGPTDNLPAVFEIRFGWEHRADQIAFILPAVNGHWPRFIAANSWWPAADFAVPAKLVFNSIYVIGLLLSGIGIGLQARRRDRRILLALVAPWIMLFVFAVQMQERYLLFGAAAAACCIGESVGSALLGLVLTAISASMQLVCLLNNQNFHPVDISAFGQNLSDAFPRIFSPDSGETIFRYLDATHPDLAWVVLVIGLIFLYQSLTPSPQWRRRQARMATTKLTETPPPASCSGAPQSA
jgi:hypothetical protein